MQSERSLAKKKATVLILVLALVAVVAGTFVYITEKPSYDAARRDYEQYLRSQHLPDAGNAP